jgi:hypothetical protein
MWSLAMHLIRKHKKMYKIFVDNKTKWVSTSSSEILSGFAWQAWEWPASQQVKK